MVDIVCMRVLLSVHYRKYNSNEPGNRRQRGGKARKIKHLHNLNPGEHCGLKERAV